MFYVSRANKERSERDILSRKSIRIKKMVKVGTGNMKPDDFSVTGTHNGRREPTPESYRLTSLLCGTHLHSHIHAMNAHAHTHK